MKRSTALFLIGLFWLGTVGVPVAQTRLELKMSGELRAVTNGVLARIKVSNSFFRRIPDEDLKLVMEVGDVTTFSNIINTVTNTVITNDMTNTVITMVTNTVTNVVSDAIGIHLVDPVDPLGSPFTTLFDFSDLTTLDEVDSRKRFFALGSGCGDLGEECPTNSLGTVEFSDAVLSGSIIFSTNGTPTSVSGTLMFRGDSDGGTVIFDGKLSTGNLVK